VLLWALLKGASNMADFMLYGMLAQAGWSGISSFQETVNAYQDAEQACKDNETMVRLTEELNAAISQGLSTTIYLNNIAEVIQRWRQSWVTLEDWAARLRKQFLQHYVLFLGFLAFVTMNLFFAVEKKAARLDKLMHKVTRIVHAEASHGS